MAIEKEGGKVDDNEARVKNLAKARNEHARQLKEDIESLTEELKTLSPKLTTNKDAKIEVKGKVYPTCTIKIGDKEVSAIDKSLGPQTLTYVVVSDSSEEVSEEENLAEEKPEDS